MNKEKKPFTILVIEDDVDALNMIVRHLKYLGYDVIVATDGMEGLKKLETGGYDFKIQLSKPGFEEIIYGEDPYPVIHMSVTSKGDVGGGGVSQYVWVAVPVLFVGLILLIARGGKPV